MTRFVTLLLTVLTLPVLACEVDWGGAQVALEDPAPEEIIEETPVEEVIVPLPPGPLLYRVRAASDGSATVVPVALWTDSLPNELDLPEEFDAAYRARFDSAFMSAGTELAFISDGRRIGSVRLEDDRFVWEATCPSAAGAVTLLVSGQQLPASGFALPLTLVQSRPAAASTVEPDRRMRTYGPVLTENILEQRGYDRAYLAQRADLATTSYTGDEGPALVATYLVNDSLKADPVSGPAVSLFFMARYTPARGYYPVWHEYRRYRTAEDREVFVHENWIAATPGRLDFLELYGNGSVRLAASLEREDARSRGIDWTESERCESRLAFAGPGGEGDSADTPATPAPVRTPATRTPAAAAGRDTAAEASRRRQTEPDIQPRPPIQLPDTTAGQ